MATNSDIITHRKLGFALSRISQNTCLEIENDVQKQKILQPIWSACIARKKTFA